MLLKTECREFISTCDEVGNFLLLKNKYIIDNIFDILRHISVSFKFQFHIFFQDLVSQFCFRLYFHVLSAYLVFSISEFPIHPFKNLVVILWILHKPTIHSWPRIFENYEAFYKTWIVLLSSVFYKQTVNVQKS
jgi:hypothetical protein